MANENSRDPTIPKPQSIPLAKIHDLPGIPISRQPDKTYGGLVTSIQSGGVKETVILRLREDGEYQLVTGYRRMRACELTKKQEIPALVYNMSLQEAIRYHGLANGKPAPPIPGKLVEPGAKNEKQEKSDIGQLVRSPPEAGVLAAHLLPLFTWVLCLQYRVFNFEGS
ncbi:ParB N-terminal domain-containing protein [Oscillospiraceae bacterium 38-13]